MIYLHALSIGTDELSDEIRVELEAEFMENKVEETTRAVGKGVSFVNIVLSSVENIQTVPSKSGWESFKAFVTSLSLFNFLKEEVRGRVR